MSERITEARLSAVEGRLGAASDGPWFAYLSVNRGAWTAQNARRWLAVIESSSPRPDGDAHFMAGARTDVADLVAEVRRLRGLIEWAGSPIAPSAVAAVKVGGAGQFGVSGLRLAEGASSEYTKARAFLAEAEAIRAEQEPRA